MSQNRPLAEDDGVHQPEVLLRITPNSSLSPRHARIFILSLAAALGLVSAAAVLAGYWLILPFAGLELAAVYWVLHLSMERGRYQEVVYVKESTLVIEKGKKKVQERVEFPRYWATIRLVSSGIGTIPSRLMIACQGKSLEIGACLTETERLGLSKRLKELLSTTQPIEFPRGS